MSEVVPLRDAVDPALFGGKAAGLAAAMRAGLPVPPGLAVSWPLAQRCADGDDAASGAISTALEGLSAPFAVRSSAVGEDGAVASFAGQHATKLGVRAASVPAAIVAVTESGHRPSALAYRSRVGLVGPVRMAVVIQSVVAADVSGVLFTRNPVTGAAERVIEAAPGLGEAVVAGMVTPDVYRVGVGGAVLSIRLGHKDIAIRLAGREGVEEVAVTGESVSRRCLDDAQIAALDELATRCEDVFAGPRDLEWSIAASELVLLQCRSVTA